MRWFMVVCGLAVSFPAGTAFAQSWEHPDQKHLVRAGFVVATSTEADNGFGFGADYEYSLYSVSLGRVIVGPAIQYVYASDKPDEACVADQVVRIFAPTGNARFVFDLHRRIQPWANIGVGPYWTSHDVANPGPGCPGSSEFKRDLELGFNLGVGADVMIRDQFVFSFAVAGHSSTQTYSTFSFSGGYRF